jgi:hypothetical protein
MKQSICASLAGALLALTISGATWADNHAKAQQVEMFTCNYVGNKDRSDLDRVIDKFRKWSAENDTSYSSWVLTPNFVNADITMDIGWLGGWQDAATMGSSLDTWMAKGIQGEFDKVISCDTHSGAASVVIKAPANPDPQGGVVSFSSCKIPEGATAEDAMAAHTEMGKFMGSQGSSGGAWMFFPNYGTGSADLDYYFVVGWENYAAMGKSREIISNGGGYQKMRELYEGRVHCDVPRVYNADLVTAAAGN